MTIHEPGGKWKTLKNKISHDHPGIGRQKEKPHIAVHEPGGKLKNSHMINRETDGKLKTLT